MVKYWGNKNQVMGIVVRQSKHIAFYPYIHREKTFLLKKSLGKLDHFFVLNLHTLKSKYLLRLN